MRKIISLILDYFCTLLVGFAVGMFIFVQYSDSVSLVAGERFFISKEMIVSGFFSVLPIIFLLLPLALILYKIRHKSNPVSSFITFILLSLANWFAFFPITLKIQTQFEKNLFEKNYVAKQNDLTKGYFRQAGGKLYYFNNNSESDSADVLMIEDTSEPATFASEKNIDISKNSEFAKAANPFRDSLTKETMTNIPYPIINVFSSIKLQAMRAWNYGFFSWICFCSLGFALCSLYSLIRFSSWRMINALGALVLSGIVIWFNDFYFSAANNSVRNFFQSLFYEGGHFNFFIEKGIEFPLFLINMLFWLIFTTIGIIIAILHKKEEV